MRRVALVMLFLSLELSAWVSPFSATFRSSHFQLATANVSPCLNVNSTQIACAAPAGITYATTALNWTQTIAGPLTGGSQANVTLTPCPVASTQPAELGIRFVFPAVATAKQFALFLPVLPEDVPREQHRERSHSFHFTRTSPDTQSVRHLRASRKVSMWDVESMPLDQRIINAM